MHKELWNTIVLVEKYMKKYLWPIISEINSIGITTEEVALESSK